GLAFSFAGRGGSDLVNVEMSTKNQQPPPQQSGQLKLSLDGGDGIDTFQISTTDFPELVEVLGVPVEEKPDPLIRVTDLVTSVRTLEASIVNAEAIGLDTAGGNDRVTMTDEQGLLSGSYTIDLGIGDDAALLSSAPAV